MNREYSHRGHREPRDPKPQKRQADHSFWKQVEEDYAVAAEDAITKMGDRLPSASSIRNILSLINNVSMKLISNKGNQLSQDIKNDIAYLRARIAYTYGRARSDKKRTTTAVFIDNTKLLELLLCVDTKSKYQIFAKYVEALIAYHKYYGGKD